MSWLDSVGNWFHHEYDAIGNKLNHIGNESLNFGLMAAKYISPATLNVEENVFHINAQTANADNAVFIGTCVLMSLALAAIVIPGGSFIVGGIVANS